MPRLLRTTLVAGLTAGTLDILYAIAMWGLRGAAPSRVLQGVASGVLGRDAFSGGANAATLGLVLHLSIAVAMAAAFVLAAARWRVLTERPWASGAAYGVALHLLMNYAVVPLSAAPMSPPTGASWFIALFPHVVLVGWPIAWVARRELLRARDRVAAPGGSLRPTRG